MIEEKLKSEIEEYLDKEYCCEFKSECKDGVRTRCSEYEEKLDLILRFATPREKRVAEYENKLKACKYAIQQIKAWCETLTFEE